MGIPVTSHGKVFHPELCQFTRLCTEVCDIDNDQSLCDVRVYQGKNKMRAAKAGIYYLYIVGKFELTEFLCHGRTESIIREEGVSTPRYYDLWIQHLLRSLDEFLGNYPLVLIDHDHVGCT